MPNPVVVLSHPSEANRSRQVANASNDNRRILGGCDRILSKMASVGLPAYAKTNASKVREKRLSIGPDGPIAYEVNTSICIAVLTSLRFGLAPLNHCKTPSPKPVALALPNAPTMPNQDVASATAPVVTSMTGLTKDANRCDTVRLSFPRLLFVTLAL